MSRTSATRRLARTKRHRLWILQAASFIARADSKAFLCFLPTLVRRPIRWQVLRTDTTLGLLPALLLKELLREEEGQYVLPVPTELARLGILAARNLPWLLLDSIGGKRRGVTFREPSL